ncbi:MAG: trigger factor [Holosporaceae bacterium]|nr:trigger factor [Holosporaceae bacterium]
MEILNKTADGLKRRYNVLIPKVELDAAVTEKLQETAKKVRLDGFRPGKAPLDVIRRMYGDSLVDEAKKKAITDSSKKIIKDEGVSVSFAYITDIVKEDENGLEFLLKFEALPSFELKDVSSIEITKYIAEIGDEKVTDVLEAIRKEHKKWIESDKNAEEGQKIVVDLCLRAPDKKLQKGEIKDLEIIMGDATLVDNFWKHFIGAKVGRIKEFSIAYPTNFSEKTFAGKTVEYKAVIKKIFDPAEHKIDDEFAKSMGYENLEQAREWAKARLVSKYDHLSKDVMSRDLLDKITDMYDFDIPQNIVDIENSVISKRITEEAQKLGVEFSSHVQSECLKISERRVRLGLVIAEIAKREKISATQNEISQYINRIALLHPGQEKAVWKTYTRSENLQAVISPILERKVTEFLLNKVKIQEKKCSIEELVALDEETFDFFKDAPKSEPKKLAKGNTDEKTKPAKKKSPSKKEAE